MLHALLNVLLGMGSVFLVLILICLIIKCFGIIPVIEAKFKKEENISKQAPVTSVPEVNEMEDTTNDEAVVAAIMAAITAYSGMSQDDFIVRSIIRR